MSKNLGKLQRVLLGACERDDSSRSERSDERLRQWHCYQVAVTDTSTGDKSVASAANTPSSCTLLSIALHP